MTSNKTQWMSRQEAALALRLTVPEVDHLISVGLLARYRIRRQYVRVLRAEVDELAQLDPWLLRNA